MLRPAYSVLPAALVLALLLLSGCARNNETEAPTAVADAPDSSTTSLGVATFRIITGDDEEAQTFEIKDVAEGETLESVMRRIKDVPITINGSGPTAFVDQIGETSTDSSQGWTYTVDGEFANEGIGTMELSPPVTIEWTFGSMP